MSIGPAPNLGGGIHTAAACSNNGSGGNGGISPNTAPPFTASLFCTINCNCNFGGGGSGGGGGSCGGGGATVQFAPQGASPQVPGSSSPICIGTDVSTECGCLPISDFGGYGSNYGSIIQCLQNSPDPCSCIPNGIGDGGSGTLLIGAAGVGRVSTAPVPRLGVVGPGGPSTQSLSAPPTGARTPPPIVGSGFGLDISLVEASPNSGLVEGFPVYCQETGETLNSNCFQITFFSTTSINVHLILGTHNGQNCSDSSVHTYNGPNMMGTTESLPPGLNVQLTRV